MQWRAAGPRKVHKQQTPSALPPSEVSNLGFLFGAQMRTSAQVLSTSEHALGASARILRA